jgi:hypothetical protein
MVKYNREMRTWSERQNNRSSRRESFSKSPVWTLNLIEQRLIQKLMVAQLVKEFSVLKEKEVTLFILKAQHWFLP